MIFIALGANLASSVGFPAQTLLAALDRLAASGITVLSVSAFYRTPAWPDPGDPPFVNAAARIDTALSPQALMTRLHDMETAFGRIRSARNAPRTLDLDLIDYDGRVEEGPPILPHPRLSERAFVLVPLRDLAPDWRHPATGRSIGALLEALPPGAGLPERLDGRG
ncbi:MAG TPA: 2-amino-4-hydroxy-6-hydroxymethyldihydropteridine diphosphokinase [Rhizomicrobium sp.]